jgi:hypothetical protein
MKDSLAPFKGVNAIPCPLGMDIEFKPGKDMRDRVNAAHNPCGITE